MRTYYPLFLNIGGRRCVVVGGGQVALRKVKTLLEHKARVEVISPDLCPELGQLAEKREIEVQYRKYQSGDLEGALIAIAATSESGTNLKVAEEARRSRVLVNVVDDVENSDFILPSCLRRGDITIAVSTGGRSPALARRIRAKLEKDLGKEYASLALLIAEVRSELKREKIEVDANTWQEALDLDLLTDLIKRGDWEGAKAILVSNLKGQKG
jgi:siroheme synthase-like protein